MRDYTECLILEIKQGGLIIDGVRQGGLIIGGIRRVV